MSKRNVVDSLLTGARKTGDLPKNALKEIGVSEGLFKALPSENRIALSDLYNSGRADLAAQYAKTFDDAGLMQNVAASRGVSSGGVINPKPTLAGLRGTATREGTAGAPSGGVINPKPADLQAQSIAFGTDPSLASGRTANVAPVNASAQMRPAREGVMRPASPDYDAMLKPSLKQKAVNAVTDRTRAYGKRFKEKPVRTSAGSLFTLGSMTGLGSLGFDAYNTLVGNFRDSLDERSGVIETPPSESPPESPPEISSESPENPPESPESPEDVLLNEDLAFDAYLNSLNRPSEADEQPSAIDRLLGAIESDREMQRQFMAQQAASREAMIDRVFGQSRREQDFSDELADNLMNLSLGSRGDDWRLNQESLNAQRSTLPNAEMAVLGNELAATMPRSPQGVTDNELYQALSLGMLQQEGLVPGGDKQMSPLEEKLLKSKIAQSNAVTGQLNKLDLARAEKEEAMAQASRVQSARELQTMRMLESELQKRGLDLSVEELFEMLQSGGI